MKGDRSFILYLSLFTFHLSLIPKVSASFAQSLAGSERKLRDPSFIFQIRIRQIHQDQRQNKIRHDDRRARVIFGNALSEKKRE